MGFFSLCPVFVVEYENMWQRQRHWLTTQKIEKIEWEIAPTLCYGMCKEAHPFPAPLPLIQTLGCVSSQMYDVVPISENILVFVYIF